MSELVICTLERLLVGGCGLAFAAGIVWLIVWLDEQLPAKRPAAPTPEWLVFAIVAALVLGLAYNIGAVILGRCGR